MFLEYSLPFTIVWLFMRYTIFFYVSRIKEHLLYYSTNCSLFIEYLYQKIILIFLYKITNFPINAFK